MMTLTGWFAIHWIEIFGAVTGIIYVFLEIKQSLWLWPVGIVTSAVYIWVFFHGKLYADMSLQGYYLVISVAGWYWWVRGAGRRAQGSEHRAQGAGKKGGGAGETGGKGEGEIGGKGEGKTGGRGDGETGRKGDGEIGRKGDEEKNLLKVTRIKMRLAVVLVVVFGLLYSGMFFILSRLTDSPVPGFDAFLTSLSIVATWMLARKIYEHWFLWIVVNSVATILFLVRGLYPTVILYAVYCIMSFAGLREWKKSL